MRPDTITHQLLPTPKLFDTHEQPSSPEQTPANLQIPTVEIAPAQNKCILQPQALFNGFQTVLSGLPLFEPLRKRLPPGRNESEGPPPAYGHKAIFHTP